MQWLHGSVLTALLSHPEVRTHRFPLCTQCTTLALETSTYAGNYLHRCGRVACFWWMTRLKLVQIMLGTFETQNQAALAHDLFAVLVQDDLKTNFSPEVYAHERAHRSEVCHSAPCLLLHVLG
jgi:hypothetical protein